MIIVALSSIINVLGEYSSTSIYIDEYGVPTLRMSVYVSNGLNMISLPAKPIQATINIRPSSISWFYNEDNNAIVIMSSTSTNLEISYIINTSISNGVLTLTISTNQLIDLVASPSILILSVPDNIIDYKKLSDGTQIITFNGSAVISYVVIQTQRIIQTTTKPAAPTETPIKTPATTQYQVTTYTLTTTSVSSPATPPPQGIGVRELILLIIAAVVVVVIIALILRRK